MGKRKAMWVEPEDCKFWCLMWCTAFATLMTAAQITYRRQRR